MGHGMDAGLEFWHHTCMAVPMEPMIKIPWVNMQLCYSMDLRMVSSKVRELCTSVDVPHIVSCLITFFNSAHFFQLLSIELFNHDKHEHAYICIHCITLTNVQSYMVNI